MNDWRETTLGDEIELAYGKSLPAHAREAGRFGVFGSNGLVGTNAESCVEGPGIVVGRKGSVGEVSYSGDAFWPIDTTYFVVNKGGHDWRYLYHLLRHSGLTGLNSHSAVPGLNREDAYAIEAKFPLRDEQGSIASALDCVESSIQLEAAALENTQELKRAAMRELFTRGLRGEAQKETEIGLVPESWDVKRLDSRAQVVSTRMSYTELESAKSAHENSVRVIGIKVSDMNRVGNETVLTAAALERNLDAKLSEYRCAPPGTIVFPKRGAAIATNKKRMTTTWSVFDPNVIGVVPGDLINSGFLFHWFQSFDLKAITEPGPTPQLNKKHLDPLLIPVPPTTAEQTEIVAILDALDRKIALHRQKRAVLGELFQSLLHKLMTGEIRVTDLDLSALEQAQVSGTTV